MILAYDCEVYPNYFLCIFKCTENNKKAVFEIIGEKSSFTNKSRILLNNLMLNNTTIGYNSINYDNLIVSYAINGATCDDLYNLSSHIINNDTIWFNVAKKYSLDTRFNDTNIDLSSVSICPKKTVSLKLYAGRIHFPNLQDLPFEPCAKLSPLEQIKVKTYCENDVDVTTALYKILRDSNEIAIRDKLSKTYNYNLNSKSRAQLAEKIIKIECEKIAQKQLYRVEYPKNYTFNYSPSYFLKFETELLSDLFDTIKNTKFELNEKGAVVLPKEISKKFKIGELDYKLGIGGLHSVEKNRSVVTDDNTVIIDKDVTSYYPSLILNQKLYPKAVGETFLRIYQRVVDKRISAKKDNDTLTSDCLKIVINSAFGKFGEKYSILYSPENMIQTTLTGQLSLLMLIEKLEINGITVISANTDGVTFYCDKQQLKLAQSLCAKWESDTGFALEECEYTALYSRDVNNYFAVKKDGGVKTKGIFAKTGLAKNPNAYIEKLAVIDHLTKNKKIEDTIINNKDITNFVIVRKVTGGAIWKNEYLGKVVRWIYSAQGEEIKYKKNGNKVPLSDCAYPIMRLPTLDIPSHIDRQLYITNSIKLLTELGINYA